MQEQTHHVLSLLVALCLFPWRWGEEWALSVRSRLRSVLYTYSPLTAEAC